MNTLASSLIHTDTRAELLSRYGVEDSARFNPERAVRARVDYLKKFVRTTGVKGFVLGISGGVDSTAAGKLAQLACQELRDEGVEAFFIAMRLPAGIQIDEDDAQAALDFIAPDHEATANIGPAANELNAQCLIAVREVGHAPLRAEQMDFHKGNLKARLRMAAQYHLAAVHGCAVLGTDHSAEAVLGFYTKFGDGACDLLVLNGLNKHQVRLCARHMGAPDPLWAKPPTADLEELAPGKLDEQAMGVSYEALDAYLEGKSIDADLENRILAQYRATRHKREPIVGFGDL